MNRVAITLAFALVLSCAEQSQSQPASGGGQSNTPTSQKQIKDQAEYNAYIAALNTADPAAKGAAMDAFVKQYPQSIVKVEALEQAMGAYQQLGNQAKVMEEAKAILEINPNHVQAMAILCFFDRTQATQGNADALKGAADYCSRGLQALPSWPKPEGVSQADFDKIRNQMTKIFYGGSGFVALNRKDYASARDSYLKSLQIDPSDVTDNYQLSIACLEANPMELVGLWYAAKAVVLAKAQNNAGAVAIENYGKSRYHKYHGSDDGWSNIVAKAAKENAPAADFTSTIAKAPTPQEIACKVVQENDPADLSFSDYEFILANRDAAPCNKEAADKVWNSIQNKEKQGQAKLKIPVKIISATRDSVSAAISEDSQNANKADLQVTLEKPILKPPAPGTMTSVVGVITRYEPNPFMFIMEQGDLPDLGPKPPVRR